MPIWAIGYDPAVPKGARTTINVEETGGNNPFNPHPHPLIMGLKVMGAQCQWHPECHHCQTYLKAPDVLSEVGNVVRLEPTRK